MDAARRGIITPEMKAVAAKEYRTEEEIRELVAKGQVAICANKLHTCIDPNGVGSMPYTLYDTFGTVVITFISNSRSRRSCTISIWSKPKKPQRKPKPNATDDSGMKVNEASFSCNFSSDARRFS